MTKEHALHIAKCLSAFAEGQVVQLKTSPSAEWRDLTENRGLVFDSSIDEIRIKPREPREWWVNIYKISNTPCIHSSKELADKFADIGRVECVRVVEDLTQG